MKEKLKQKADVKEPNQLEVTRGKKHYTGKARDVKHIVHIDLVKYLIRVAVILVLVLTGTTAETLKAVARLFGLGP